MSVKRDAIRSLQTDLTHFIQAILKNDIEERITGTHLYTVLMDARTISVAQKLRTKDKKILSLLRTVCKKKNNKALEKIIIESKPMLEYVITDLICNYYKEGNGKHKSAMLLNRFPTIRKSLLYKSQILKRRVRLDKQFKKFIDSLKKVQYTCVESCNELEPARQTCIINRIKALFFLAGKE